MILFVLRHAIAEERRPGLADSRRQLTDDGRKKLKQVLNRARRAGVAPGVILTSSLVRAVDSAHMAAEALGYKGDLVQTATLSPRAKPEATWDEVRKYSTEQQVMVTGHEPHLSKFIAHALAAPGLQIDLRKGAIVCIDIDPAKAKPTGVLQWILTPRLAK